MQRKKRNAKSRLSKSKQGEGPGKRKGKGPLPGSKRGKGPQTKSDKKRQKQLNRKGRREDDEESASCIACNITWTEDLELGLERTWIQCDVCNAWVHAECLLSEVDDSEAFSCPDCSK